jgi:ribonuclease HI
MKPMTSLIKSLCRRAATRMATLDSHHPLYHTIQKAAGHYPSTHASPLHDILHFSKIKPFSSETIDFRPRHPCWKPPFRIEIASSKEEACAAERDGEDDIRIYSDGSGKDGKVGASAIMYFGFRVPRTARFHLGSLKQHTVYEGECAGQLLGLRLLLVSGVNLDGRKISIGVDSQAVIKRHRNRGKASASYIIEEIYKIVNTLVSMYPRADFTVRWTPGHVGISGNEEADVEAKKAADSATNNTNSHFGIFKKELPISRTAHRGRLEEIAKAGWRRKFRESPRYQRVSRIDSSMPSDKYRRLTTTLPKRHASILTQLRTNHIPLQAYLHRFKLADSPTCPHCQEHPETVTHYLFHCAKHAVHRTQLKRELGLGTRQLDWGILNERKSLPALFRFIKSTNRFDVEYGDFAPVNIT